MKAGSRAAWIEMHRIATVFSEGDHSMNQNLIDAGEEIRVAHEAATWYLRLEDGFCEADRLEYVRWLESAENMEALLFLYDLRDALSSWAARATDH